MRHPCRSLADLDRRDDGPVVEDLLLDLVDALRDALPAELERRLLRAPQAKATALQHRR